MATKKNPTFEQAVERLQVIADTLENQNPALAEALTLYEEGAALLKQCTGMLDDAREKITVLSKSKSEIPE